MKRLALLLLLTACGRAEVGALDRPSPTPRSIPNLPPPTCTIDSVTPSLINAWATDESRLTNQLAIGGDALHRLTPRPDDRRLGVQRIDLVTGAEAFVTSTGDSQLELIDASEDAVIYTVGVRTLEVVLQPIDGRPMSFGSGSSSGRSAIPDYYGAERSRLSKSWALWTAGPELFRYDRIEREQRRTWLGVFDLIALDDESYAYVDDATLDSRIFVQKRRVGVPEMIAEVDEPVTALALANGNLYYVVGGALFHYDFDTAEVRVLDEGPCGPPSADGDDMVAACGVPPEFGTVLPPGDRLIYFDGTDVVPFLTSNTYLYAPRIDDGVIAWIDYPSPDTMCPGAPTGAGKIWVAAPGTVAPIEVASVGAPCLCCGSIFPPVEFVFEGGYLAWSYAEVPRSFSGIAVARVETTERCE